MQSAGKLRLSLDELRVETFDTAAADAGRGTVRGHEPPDTSTGDYWGCPCDTRDNTCLGGCGPSQPHTCPQPGQCEDMDTIYLTCFGTCYWQGGQPMAC